MATQISKEQQSLHLKLKFLAAIKYSDLDQPSSRFRLSDTANLPNDKNELKALNIMAACLTTGYLGDVVAVTFLHESSTFVIARNSPRAKENSSKPQKSLRDHTQKLMAALIGQGHPVEVQQAVLPIVVGYCEDNIMKRIQKLRTSFGDLSILASAKDPLITDVTVALEGIRNSSGTQEELAVNFRKLAACAYLLVTSPFWAETRDGAGKKIERIHRHLLKICQYSADIVTLIEHLRKHELHQKHIHLGFVDEDAGLSIPPGLPSAEDVFNEIPNPSQFGMQKIYERFPHFRNSWQQGSGKIALHAELQIIDYVDKQSPSGMLIGISKRCCLCCALYIYYLNTRSPGHQTWRTSGCHGKVYENWALPGKYPEVDTNVIADVTKTLQTALVKLASHTQHSDDFASSQDEAMAKTLKEMSLRDAALQPLFPVSHAEINKFMSGCTKVCRPDATQGAQIRKVIRQKRMDPSNCFVALVVFGKKVDGHWFYRYSVEVSKAKHFGSNKNTQQIAFYDINQSVDSWDHNFGEEILRVLKDRVSNAYSGGL